MNSAKDLTDSLIFDPVLYAPRMSVEDSAALATGVVLHLRDRLKAGRGMHLSEGLLFLHVRARNGEA